MTEPSRRLSTGPPTVCDADGALMSASSWVSFCPLTRVREEWTSVASVERVAYCAVTFWGSTSGASGSRRQS